MQAASAPRPNRYATRRFARICALLVLVTGFAISALSARWTANRNEANEIRLTETTLVRHLEEIPLLLQGYEKGVRAARGAILVGGLEHTRRATFLTYMASRDIEQEFPGARGFGFVRKVPGNAADTFVAEARRNIAPDFVIQQSRKHDGDRYVIALLEPQATNINARGLDIAADPQAYAAALSSMQTGHAAATAPLALSGSEIDPFLLLLPVYAPGLPHATTDQREAATIGWAFAALEAGKVLSRLDERERAFTLRIRDVTAGHEPVLLLSTGAFDKSLKSTLTRQRTLPVYGREWSLTVQPTAAFISGLRQISPTQVFVLGNLLTLIAAAMIIVLSMLAQRRRETYQNQELLADIVANSTDSIVVESLEGFVISWNEEAERAFGYSANEAIGRPLTELILPSDRRDEDADVLERIVQGARVAPFDTVRRRHDGTIVEVSIAAVPIRDAESQVRAVAQVIRDIQELKAAEASLRVANARLASEVHSTSRQASALQHSLRSITDALPSMIGYWDKQLVNRFANQAYAQWFGLEPESMQGLPMDRVLDAPLREKNRPFVEAALKGESVTFERTIPSPHDGTTRHFLAHYRPDIVNDEVRGYYALIHDITEVNESKNRLAALVRENEGLLNTLHRHALVSVADRNGHITEVNDAFCAISGYSREELIGQDHRIVNSGVHSHEFWRGLWDSISEGKPWRGVICNRTKNGRLYWVDSIIAPFADDHGHITRYISIRIDITAQHQLEQQLRDATSTAERASQAKSEFLANMSHEIRTPLNAIIGLGYLLDQTSLDADQRRFVSKIQFAGRSLLGVVNNVLDLSKIEAGEMALDESPFELPQLIRDIGQMMAPQANAKGVDLLVQPSSELPAHVVGDVTRFRQVLTNLVSNAVKFTEAGHVSLKVQCSDVSRDRIRLRCVVEDTGIGIESSVLAKIFTPFTQGDASTTRRFGGTGLGLTIARRLVELMGGEIGVTSRVGEGSEFWFEIPLRIASGGVETNHPSRAGLRLLITHAGEDATALNAMVRALGWQPQVAAGDQQLQQSLSVAADFQPDVILVGRKASPSRPTDIIGDLQTVCNSTLPPIIFISETEAACGPAEAPPRDIDVTLAWPVTSSGLFNAVNSAVARQEDSLERLLESTISDSLDIHWLAGVRILVADDSDINLEVASRILEKQGATVATVSNGEAAVAHVRAHHGALDVVLMDVQMPVLDGNEATRQIRSEPALSNLPILALTAGALVGERQRALESGMSDFLSKPFDPQTLVRKIRRLVEKARNAPLPVAVLNAPTRETTADRTLPSLDAAIVRQMFGGDTKLFESMLARVLREYEDAALPQLFDPNDAAARLALKNRMHKLKGSAGMVGATAIARLAAAIERIVQDSTATEGAVGDLLGKLASALTTLREEAAGILETQRTAAIAAVADTDDEPSLEPCQREELIELLESQNLAAIERFSTLYRPLLKTLGENRFTRFRDAMDSLDFQLGATILRQAEPAPEQQRAS